ncbi:hypothetical protein [Methylocystis parvus]|uniref:hypothetical protein n=1 Tax=Methylocystis parvus TaxID=134 RepID=UPI003C7383A5
MTGMRGPDLPISGGIDSFIVNFDPSTGADVFRAPAALVASSLAPLLNFPATPGHTFYSDFSAPHPRTVNLGDKWRCGSAIGKPETSSVPDGTWTFGANYGADYIGRDAQCVIGMANGGVGLGVIGRSSDYSNGGGGWKWASAFSAYIISDSAVEGSGAQALYLEVPTIVAGASAIGAEVVTPNYYGLPPTINPFQLNNNGATIGLGFDGGADTRFSGRDTYPNSAGVTFGKLNQGGQFMRGVVFGRDAIYGSNGAGAVTKTLTSVLDSPIATLADVTDVVAGMFVSHANFAVWTFIRAVLASNRVLLSTSATASGSGAATLTNTSAVAIELAPHHEIKWTQDTTGARGFFLRDDTIAGQSTLGLVASQYGVWWTNPLTETIKGGVDNAGNLFVGQDRVVGAARAAWGAPSGTLSRAAFASHTAPTISASYTQSEVQTIANRLATVSQTLAALLNDLHVATSSGGHGLLKA